MCSKISEHEIFISPDCTPILIQRNDGSAGGFNRSWNEFKVGFGDRTGDDGVYWLGNEILHELTKIRNRTLRYVVFSTNLTRYMLEYSNFSVDNENANYTVHLSGYDGFAGDGNAGGPLGRTDRMSFSTYDRDNDNWKNGNCSSEHGAGFWYDKCGYNFVNSKKMAWKWPIGEIAVNLNLKFSRIYLLCQLPDARKFKMTKEKYYTI